MSQVATGQISPKSNAGGMAFDLILEPPKRTESPCLTPRSKAKRESADLEQKMQQAEARKQAIESEKKQNIINNRIRAQEAIDKMRQEEEIAKAAMLEKIQKKLEGTNEKRNAHICGMRTRLQNQLKHVEVVCQRATAVTNDLDERLKKKYEQAEANRRDQLNATIKKMQACAKHMEEVCKSCDEINEASSKEIMEKHVEKMENAMKRREEGLNELHQRLQVQEKRGENVRKNKNEGSGDATVTEVA